MNNIITAAASASNQSCDTVYIDSGLIGFVILSSLILFFVIIGTIAFIESIMTGNNQS